MEKINAVLEYLIKKGYDVKVVTVTKNGVEKEGIQFNTGEICPVNYMPIAGNETIEEIAERFIEQSKVLPEVDTKDFLNFELAKSKLYPCLGNEKATRNIVRRNVCGDYYEYVRVFLTEEMSISITPEILNSFNICEEELFSTALANAKAEKRFVHQTFLGMMDILTSTSGAFGAAAILDRELLDKLCEDRDTNTLYIVPSSIHEVIVLTNVDREDVGTWIRNTCTEVNTIVTSDTEILGTEGIRYDYRTKILSIMVD